MSKFRSDKIDQRTVDIVNGFIRTNHRLLLISSQCTLFQNIPFGIYSLCTMYFYMTDYFQIIGKNMTSSNDNKTVTNLVKKEYDSFDNSTFGKMIISSLNNDIYKHNIIYKWDLRVYSKEIGSILVGIFCGECDNSIGFYFNDNTPYYGYCNDGQRINHIRRSFIEDSLTFNDSDKISIELDLKQKVLSFHVNDQVITDNITVNENIEYRLAVTVAHQYDSVTIEKYSEFIKT